VSPAFAQRAILLTRRRAVRRVVALAVAEQREAAREQSDLPAAVPSPGGGWYEALAGPESPRAYGRRTACGKVLERKTLGVSHPVAVCGAKIYIGHGRTVMLTQVVAQGPGSAAPSSD
jgi:hypothetical protein